MEQELKDYDIMDVEAMDDARLEESPTGRIFVSRVYLKDEVDAVLAEKDAEIARLKHEVWEADERAIDAGATSHEKMQESESKDKEIRRLTRALYKACANWARSERYTEATWHGDEYREELWAKVQDKCRAMVEKFK